MGEFDVAMSVEDFGVPSGEGESWGELAERLQETDVDGYLRFAHANVGYVLDGLEDATVRYGFDRDLDVGQLVWLLTPEGTIFAIAEIEDVYTAAVRHAYHDMVRIDGRNHPATDVDDLHGMLIDHYPEASVGFEDTVTVVYFDVVRVGGPR